MAADIWVASSAHSSGPGAQQEKEFKLILDLKPRIGFLVQAHNDEKELFYINCVIRRMSLSL